MSNIQKGKYGEELACKFLSEKGYKIIETNYKYSRYGEVDIIALDKDELCFIEVKTRSSLKYGIPFEAITKDKLSKIYSTMQAYKQQSGLKYQKCRVDAISIELTGKSPIVKHIKNIEF